MNKSPLIFAGALCCPTGCAAAPRGAVCFTFDDYHGENWLKALPIFRKYDGHATFFVFREITSEKAAVMKQLKDAARGQGSVIALLTALIAGGIDSLTLYDTPESFSNMAETRLTMWPHSMMPMGILKITDLPDIRRAVAEKMPLKVVNFMDNYLRREQ